MPRGHCLPPSRRAWEVTGPAAERARPTRSRPDRVWHGSVNEGGSVRERRSSMKRFQNRVVLVTGGTSGIGKATALAFAAEGARVVVAGRRETEGTAVVADIRRHGGQATFVATDVTRDADVRKLVRSEEHTSELQSPM